MIKRFFSKIVVMATFNIGVNVIGIPESITHKLNVLIKERNVRQRYSYINQ